jgi:hypothetical protein
MADGWEPRVGGVGVWICEDFEIGAQQKNVKAGFVVSKYR